MIGVMHEILFGFVKRNFGEAGLTELRRRAQIEGKEFRLDTIYDDAEWRRIVGTAIEMAGGDPIAAEKALARYAGEDLVLRFGGFFKGATRSLEMIKRQPKIHNNLAKGLGTGGEEAQRRVTDKFNLEEISDNEVVMHYRSPNRHCVLYIGLAEWLADHFDDPLEIWEDRCQKKGDDECTIHVKASSRGA